MKDPQFILTRPDKHNFAIARKTTNKKTGEVSYKPFKFYPSLQLAAQELLEFQIPPRDYKDLQDLIVVLKASQAAISSLIDRYHNES